MTDQSQSAAAIVADALEGAAQAVIQPDVPLALVDELLGAVQGRAVADVLAARVRSIAQHGHTAEADDYLPIAWLPMEARQLLELARDHINGDHRDLAQARAAIVGAAVFVLAAIDRLDRANGQAG